ncbi:MAG: hypothetical protein HGA87_00945 [Desulfobulbaceae bacterium]|nr:hypothetical protein [Desulfobulbaceae bacterium]
MSYSISSHFVSSFDTMVKLAYQEGAKLRKYVRVKNGVVGSTHKFFTTGKGVAQPRIPRTDIVPMNTAKSSATATLTDWQAGEFCDILELEKISYDEKQDLAKNVAMAIGRREDQLIIDAMAASAYSTQVTAAVGGSDTGLNIEKIVRAKRLMDDNGVPGEGRVLVTSARAIEQALLETELTSGDYNILRPLATGQIDAFAGFKFVFIESRTEGGIPLATNTRNNFAFHKDAVGLAVGHEMSVHIDWVPLRTSWLVNGLFSAGAVSIDTDGIIDVLTYES